MNFGSNFHVMLKTKSTFSGEKVKIFERPSSNLESVDVWEDDAMKSLLSWESAYQKPPGTWSQIFLCSKFQSLLSFWRVWGREVKVDTKKVFASSWYCFEFRNNIKWKVICVSLCYCHCECFGDCLCSQMNEYPMCKFSDWKRRTDCDSGLPPVSILQPVDVACLFGL